MLERAGRMLRAAILGVIAGAVVGPVAASAAPTYYLALGDSLARGIGATSGQGYVDDVFAFEQQATPGLQLVNLSCSGETTATMMNGGTCAYATGSQLGDAEAFLAAHPGQVAFVSIDIGGNDVVPCLLTLSPDPTCVASALPTTTANLAAILAGLRAAGGPVPIVSLAYYDPVLAFWLLGGAGQTAARTSVKLVGVVNGALKKEYRKQKVRVANTKKAFSTTKWALRGSYAGQTVPINVAQICAWTSMCSVNDIHPNDQGHATLAAVLEVEIAKSVGH